MLAQLPGFDFWSTQALPLLERGVCVFLPASWQHYSFMHRAVLECLFIAPMCAAIGVKVVNFRMAFFSDAISHSAFAGVAIGFLLHDAITGYNFDPRLAMVIFGVLVGLGIAVVRRKTDLPNDTVIGVFFSAVVAAGIAIITALPERSAEFSKYLYGSILTLDETDLYMSAMLAVGMLAFMLFSFNPLMLIGLNDELAHSRSIKVRAYDYVFSMLLALVIMTLIRTAGILLVTALLVVPAAAARNLARSVSGMFWWATVIALVATVSGTLASFCNALGRVGTGSVIVLAAALCFALSLMAARE